MPDFEPDYLSAPSAHLHVYSVMVLPRNAEARRRFAQAVAAERVAESLSSPSRADQPVAGPIARFLYDAPKLDDAFPDRRRESVESSIRFAGWALGFILRAAEHGQPELASLLEACRRASAMRSGKRHARASRATVETSWRNYGCVAHLWLAHRCIGGDAGFEQCVDQRKLLVFLANAENLRRRGEASKHKQSKTPIIDPETSWKVPADFPLPALPFGERSGNGEMDFGRVQYFHRNRIFWMPPTTCRRSEDVTASFDPGKEMFHSCPGGDG